MVAVAIMFAIIMCFFGQAPDVTQPKAPAPKRTIPAVHPPAQLAVAIQEPLAKQSTLAKQSILVKQGRRPHAPAARVESESAAVQTSQLELPGNPQIQKIILDSPVLLPPFPAEHNVHIGTPRARLVQAFGKPALRARTMQQEQLIETYIYEQPDLSTFVRMKDGSVVSTYTARPQPLRVLPSEPDPDF